MKASVYHLFSFSKSRTIFLGNLFIITIKSDVYQAVSTYDFDNDNTFYENDYEEIDLDLNDISDKCRPAV